MSGCHCDDTVSTLSLARDTARRWVLWTVLAINAVLFLGEFTAC